MNSFAAEPGRSQLWNLNRGKRTSKRIKWLGSLIRHSWSLTFSCSFHLLYLKYLEVLLGKRYRESFLPTQGMWLQNQVKWLLSVRASSGWQKNASWTPKAAGISTRQLYLACLPWLCRLPCQVTFSTSTSYLSSRPPPSVSEQHCHPRVFAGTAFYTSRGSFYNLASSKGC